MTDEQKFSYRVELLNGRMFDITSTMDFRSLIVAVRADGYIIAMNAYAPHHAIAAIVPLAQAPQPILASGGQAVN